MAQLNDDYSQMAADARALAAEQVLENVRQKHLAAAASWDRLAHANRKMAVLRARRLAEQAGRLGASAGREADPRGSAVPKEESPNGN